jgi:hypothetical protein
LRAIPPPDDPGTTQIGRDRIDHSHAGYPQGLLTRRFSSYLVSYWLTNAIDRIVKETPAASQGVTRRAGTTFWPVWRCFALSHRRHRPEQRYIKSSSRRPLASTGYWRGKGNTNAKISKVNTPLRVFFRANGHWQKNWALLHSSPVTSSLTFPYSEANGKVDSR